MVRTGKENGNYYKGLLWGLGLYDDYCCYYSVEPSQLKLHSWGLGLLGFSCLGYRLCGKAMKGGWLRVHTGYGGYFTFCMTFLC